MNFFFFNFYQAVQEINEKRGKTKILQKVALLGMLFRKKGLIPGSQTRTCTKVYYHTDIRSIVMNLTQFELEFVYPFKCHDLKL